MQAFIQQVKNSLDENHNLKEESKEGLFLMIQKIYQTMSDMEIFIPQDLLIERLKTISLEKGETFVNSQTYQYDVYTNKVTFCERKINEQNQANIFCQSVLAMAYLKETDDPNKGIDDHKFAALAKGTLEICANYIAPNFGEIGIYEDEQIITNLMNDITNGKLLDAFLQVDSQMLEETLREHNLITINSYANYNLIARPVRCKSQLGEIEQKLIRIFFQNPPVEIRQNLDSFESHLVTKKEVMSDPAQYDFTNVKSYCDTKKGEYQYQYGDLKNVIPLTPKDMQGFIPENATMEIYSSSKKNI